MHVIEMQAEGIRVLAAVNHALMQNAGGRRPAGHGAPRRTHLPQNKELREWQAFRAYFQKLEERVRRDNHLQSDDEVTKEMIYAAGGPSPKTMTRHQEYHGLKPVQWPPSTWPKHPP